MPQRGTRPTTERVREALFSALEAQSVLAGARVLDLYAGSGALGLEALSRGAACSVCIEADRKAADVLRRNVSKVGLPGLTVRQGKVRSVLAGAATEPFDLVLADPPYALSTAELLQTFAELAVGGWSAPGTLVVVERPRQEGELDWPPPFEAVRSRSYGDNVLHWARHGDADGEAG